MNPVSSEASINNNDLTLTKVKAQEVCPICLEGFNPRDLDLVGHELIKDEKIVVVHLCHRLCIGTWLSMPSSRKRCPICNVVIQKWRAKSSGAEIESDVLPGTIRTRCVGYLFFNRWRRSPTILSHFSFYALQTVVGVLIIIPIIFIYLSTYAIPVLLLAALMPVPTAPLTFPIALVISLFVFMFSLFQMWVIAGLMDWGPTVFDSLFEGRIARPILAGIGIPG